MHRDDLEFGYTAAPPEDDTDESRLDAMAPPDDEDDEDDNETTVIMTTKQVSKLQQIARQTGKQKRPQQGVKKTMIGMPVVFPKQGGAPAGPPPRRPTPPRSMSTGGPTPASSAPPSAPDDSKKTMVGYAPVVPGASPKPTSPSSSRPMRPSAGISSSSPHPGGVPQPRPTGAPRPTPSQSAPQPRAPQAPSTPRPSAPSTSTPPRPTPTTPQVSSPQSAIKKTMIGMPAQLPNLNKPGSGVPDLGFEKEPERTLVMSAPPDFDSLLQQVEQSKKSTMTAPTEENAEATVAMPAITDEMLNAAPPAPRPPVAQAPMPPSPRPQATPTPTPTPVVSSTPPPAIASAPTPSPSPGPAFRPDINSQATIPPHANLSAPPLVRGPQPGGPGPQFNPGAPQGPSGPTSLGGGLNQAGSASPVFQQRQSPPRPQPTPSQMPAPQSMAPNQRAGHAPKVQVAAKPEKTPRGFIAFIALLALLLAAVTWVGPMLAAADKPLDANKKPIAEAVKSGLKSNWPVPVYGDVFENITDWNEGQLPLVVFIGAMLLFGLLPMPYMLRALVIGGAGAAMFVLAAKQGVDTKTIPLALLDDKVYGLPSGAILLGTLLMPIALFMRGHYRDSTLARILVALGLLVTAFVYGGIQLIDTAHFKNVVLLQQIDGITKGKFLADKLQAVMLTLPLVFSVLGVLAFMDKTKSGLCGLWGFLWVVSVFGSPLVYTIFSTRSADWKSVGAVAGVGFGAWLLAIGLTMTIGLGHFLGEIGKKVSKPD